MVVLAEQLLPLQTNGAVAERRPFRAAGDNADVLGHGRQIFDGRFEIANCRFPMSRILKSALTAGSRQSSI
jgi:hypothetical protein